MPKTQSQSRKQRKDYERWLKKNNTEAYKQWKSESLERGRALTEEQEEKIRQYESEYYEKKQTNMILNLRSQGFSDSDIDKEIAIWVKTIKSWGSKEKPLSAERARKEYQLETANNTTNDNDSAK